MNLNELSIFPDIEEIKEGSKIDSAQFNRMFTSIEESILRAILNGRDIKQYTAKLQKGSIASYYSLEAMMSKMSIPTDGLTLSAYDVNLLNTNVLVDNIYGNITANIVKEFSKIPRVNGIVNPSLIVELKTYEQDPGINYLSTSNSTKIFSNTSDIFDAFDGKNDTFWLQDVEPNHNFYMMKVDLPPTLTTRFNMIQIDPYPIYGLQIMDIIVVDKYAVHHSLLNSGNSSKFSFIGTNPLIGHSGAPIKIYTTALDTSGVIYIKFRPISKSTVVGFSNIDFKFIDFTSENIGKINNTEQIIAIPSSTNRSNVDKYITLSKVELNGYLHVLTTNISSTLNNILMLEIAVGPTITNTNNIIFSKWTPISTDIATGVQQSYSFLRKPNECLYARLTMNTNNLATGVVKYIKLSVDE